MIKDAEQDPKRWHVGQEVNYLPLLVNARHVKDPTPTRHVITRIGRKWVYATSVGGGFEGQYDAVTGFANGRGYSPTGRILTDNDLYVEKERAEALRTLSEHGVDFKMGACFPSELLTALVATIDDHLAATAGTAREKESK